MSTSIVSKATPTTSIQTGPASAIGPALVSAIDKVGTACTCLVGEQLVSVTMAMPLRYQPAIGDVLLVATDRDGSAHYAIGLLSGTGTASFETHGDLELRSTGGAVRIAAATELDLSARTMRLRGRRIEVVAEQLVTKAIDWLAQIRERLQLRAKRRQTRIDELDDCRSKRSVLRADGPVSIDGSTIHLG